MTAKCALENVNFNNSCCLHLAGLTAALPCGPSNINNIDIETAAKYLTEMNLMTYDFFGAWSPTTGVNGMFLPKPLLFVQLSHLLIFAMSCLYPAPLYDQDWGGDETKDFSVDGCVKNWIKGGGLPSAINIGLVSVLSLASSPMVALIQS